MLVIFTRSNQPVFENTQRLVSIVSSLTSLAHTQVVSIYTAHPTTRYNEKLINNTRPAFLYSTEKQGKVRPVMIMMIPLRSERDLATVGIARVQFSIKRCRARSDRWVWCGKSVRVRDPSQLSPLLFYSPCVPHHPLYIAAAILINSCNLCYFSRM